MTFKFRRFYQYFYDATQLTVTLQLNLIPAKWYLLV